MSEQEMKDYLAQFRPDKDSFRGETVVHFLLMIYNKMIRQNGIFLADYNVTGAQFDMIMVIKMISDLREPGEGISQQELSKRLMVTEGGVTRIIDRMIKQGWVSRKPSKEDRRFNSVTLTKKGEALFAAAYKNFEKLLESYVEDVTDLPALTKMLGQWFYSLRKFDNP
ncbi:DNA-binding MarR family transcriptional regulator [Elusimicrobium posterum]|uniref:MarR family winged helix-turn-helix transcriptional regulator n=1 Tax=Elusimicrobium posterum TaxID=3116653 RepID=UPI003C791757